MNVRHFVVNALIVGSLATAPVALMAADQLRTQDRLHASDVAATQLRTQQRDRLHVQDPATCPKTMTQSRAQMRNSATSGNSTRTRAQRRERVNK